MSILTPQIKEFIKNTYPHAGLYLARQKFGISFPAMRSFADKQSLKMLPKKERLCIECGEAYQLDRYYVCLLCFNQKRKVIRRTYNVSIRARFQEMLRSCRHRSKNPCDLTVEFLEKMLESQGGLCFYSGLRMVFEPYGRGRNPYSVSIDQKVPGKGYTKDNVALCCWAVNSGKSDLPYEEYVNICNAVVKKHQL